VAIKESIQLDKTVISSKNKEPFIRTMEKDMRGVSKAAPSASRSTLPKPAQSFKGSPPSGLPMVDSFKRATPSVPSRPQTTEMPKTVLPKIKPFEPKAPAAKPFSGIKPKEKIKLKPKLNPKFVFIGLLVILIVAGAGGFFYWWNYIRVVTPITHYECQAYQCVSVEGEGEDQCQLSEDCEPAEPAVPDSLIPVDDTKVIELKLEEQDLLSSEIDQVILGNQTAGSMNRILIKLLIAQEKRYASFSEFANMMSIAIPDDLMVDDYTIFVYYPKGNEQELCQEAGIVDARCYGPRLGLVIKSTDIQTTKNAISVWEETLSSNLTFLMLASAFDDQIVGFQSDLNPSYPDSGIRYENLPISPVAINYAFDSNLLIISTSKYSLYQALDRLIGQ